MTRHQRPKKRAVVVVVTHIHPTEDCDGLSVGSSIVGETHEAQT
jgi:hypothetical protein